MTDALKPRLTPLDERVLAALEGPTRARTVAEKVYGRPVWRCDVCEQFEAREPRSIGSRQCWSVGDDAWRCDGRRRAAVRLDDDKLREVTEILNGLAAMRLAVRGRGGWWRKA